MVELAFLRAYAGEFVGAFVAGPFTGAFALAFAGVFTGVQQGVVTPGATVKVKVDVLTLDEEVSAGAPTVKVKLRV